MKRFSIIVPSLDGRMPCGLPDDPRVEVVAVRGVSPVGKARNEGLSRATGEWIAWADSDDALEAGWLAGIERTMEANPNADAIVLDYLRDGWGRVIGKRWKPSSRGLVADLIGGRLSPEVWRFVTRRELWDGLRFDETASVAEDYRLMPEVLVRAKGWAQVGILYRYIVREGSLIHAHDDAKARERLAAALDRVARWSGTEFEADARAEAVKMAGWMYDEGEIRTDARRFVRDNWLESMKNQRLGAWWKFKATMIALGLGWTLKPLYRMFAK